MSNGVKSAPDQWWNAVGSITAFGVCSVDTDGTIRLWNAGAAILLGFTAEEITGRNLKDLCSPQEREAGEAAPGIAEASFARNMLRKDGSEIFVEGTIGAFRDEAGAIAGYTIFMREAQERAYLQRRAERLHSELHQFTFTVSHDMKAPLRSVKSFSELLERRYKGQLDQDAQEYIAYIIDGAKQMEQLLSDVLAYSQAGREDKTRPQILDTTGVLQWALMNVDATAKQAGASITWDPLPSVCADQAQLAQIFQHLLSNSIKFRSEDPPRIHVTSQPDSAEMVQISISDNGIGVDSAYHERIFGVFKRLHGRDVPGTGIGLAICRKIVEAHGGRIWLDSAPDDGTTGRFTLPVA
jgi:PAS domain S-box-containing protein